MYLIVGRTLKSITSLLLLLTVREHVTLVVQGDAKPIIAGELRPNNKGGKL